MIVIQGFQRQAFIVFILIVVFDRLMASSGYALPS